MDYHSMKRSELQALCKQHKIPATSANSVLAAKLSELLNVTQEKQKPKGRQRTCIKSLVETIDETESAVSRRQSKKVRFSPEVEYERSGKKPKAIEPVVTEIKGRRKSVVKKTDETAVDNVNTVTDDDVQIPIKVTRSRAHILGKVDVVPTNENKRGRRVVKDVEKETDVVKETEVHLGKVTRSKARTVEKGDVQLEKSKPTKRAVKEVEKEIEPVKEAEKESEPVKEAVVGRTRVTRSKVQTVTDDSKDLDLNPQKKKSGRQTKKEEEKVEPSKEVKNVPVRVTRSRVQTSNDDNVVANPPVEKKRTRRNESVVDNPPIEKKRTRRNDSVVDNPPIEKKRTRRDTIVVDLSQYKSNGDEGEKLGHGGRKKRIEESVVEVSETQDNAEKATRQSRRNKANVEDSKVVNENESKVEIVIEKKVTRSKAPVEEKPPGGKGKIKAEVKEVEKPLELESKKNVTRSKSVIQPKVIEVVLPLEEPVKVPAKRDTRRTSVVQEVQVKESKKPAVVKKETVKETEMPKSPNVKTRKTIEKLQAENASENEMKEEANASESRSSRKRRGDPVVEDQIIESDPVSTRKETVAKKEESGVKTPVSTKGAMSGENRSKKRAKLCGIKESDSVDQGEKSDTIETPVSKMANLEVDDKVIETGKTPAIGESGRRFTRSAIKSDRKEPSQSAIKEQKTGTAHLSTRRTPGRFTRSAIKVDEKKQENESIHQSQRLDDAQVAPPEDAEAKSIPDETVTVATEVSKEDNTQILEETGDVDAALESVKSPTIDALSDGSHVQNEEVHVSSEIVTETEVQVAVSSEESPIPEVSEKEMESEGPEYDAGVEEPSVSVVKTVVVEESVDVSLEPSDIKGKLEEIEALIKSSVVEGVSQIVADDQPYTKIDDDDDDDHADVNDEDKKASTEKLEDVADGVDTQEVDSVVEGGDIQEPLTFDDKLQGIEMEENDIEDEKVTVPESSTHDEPEKEFNVVEAEKEPAKEPESDVVPSTGDDVHEIPILGKSDDEDEGVDDIKEHDRIDQDGEPEQDDQDVGEDEQEPVQNENVSELPEVAAKSPDRELEPSQNEDVPELPEELTKSPDQEPEMVVSLSADEVPYDTVDASTSKEAPKSPTLVEVKEEMESDKLGEEHSNHSVSQENQTIEESSPIVCTKEESTVDGLATNQLPGDIGAYESPNTEEESPVDLTVSDPPTSFKDQDGNKKEDWGNYTFETDDIQKPVSANESDDVVGQDTKDDQVPGLQTSSPAVANATEEFFNWTDSTLKALLTTPGTTQASHVKERLQSTVKFALPEEDDTEINATQNPDSSLKTLFTTPATTRVSYVKEHQDSTVVTFALPEEDDNATQIPGSSLKALFTTPATTRISHATEPEQITERSAVSDEDGTESNATQNPDSTLKGLFKTPGTTQISHLKDRQQSTVRFAFADEDDTEGDATQNPDSSLKAFSATPATTRVSHAKDRTVKFALPNEDDTENNAPQNPESSLKALFTTPATNQVSHVKEHQDITAVRFAIPDEDVTEGNVSQNPDSSLKALFETPATTRVSHVKEHQQTTLTSAPLHEDDTQIPDSSLKGLFKTPATTRVSHAKDSNESTVKFDLPDEVKGSTTPATTQVSHVKEREQSTVRFAVVNEDDTESNATQIPDSSLKTLFKTPATIREDGTKSFSAQIPDLSMKDLFGTPGTTQASYVQDSIHQSSSKFVLPHDTFEEDENQDDASENQVPDNDKKTETFGVINIEEFSHKYFDNEDVDNKQHETTQYDASVSVSSDEFKESQQKGPETENEVTDSSLKPLFKTPATKDLHQSAIKFSFPEESSGRTATTTTQDFDLQWDNEPSSNFNDENQGNVAQNQGLGEDQKNISSEVMSFEEFSQKYFDDPNVDYGAGDTSSEMKQHDIPIETPGTSHHHDASASKYLSVYNDVFGTNEDSQPKDSETADEGRREM